MYLKMVFFVVLCLEKNSSQRCCRESVWTGILVVNGHPLSPPNVVIVLPQLVVFLIIEEACGRQALCLSAMVVALRIGSDFSVQNVSLFF